MFLLVLHLVLPLPCFLFLYTTLPIAAISREKNIKVGNIVKFVDDGETYRGKIIKIFDKDNSVAVLNFDTRIKRVLHACCIYGLSDDLKKVLYILLLYIIVHYPYFF